MSDDLLTSDGDTAGLALLLVAPGLVVVVIVMTLHAIWVCLTPWTWKHRLDEMEAISDARHEKMLEDRHYWENEAARLAESDAQRAQRLVRPASRP